MAVFLFKWLGKLKFFPNWSKFDTFCGISVSVKLINHLAFVCSRIASFSVNLSGLTLTLVTLVLRFFAIFLLFLSVIVYFLLSEY